MSDWTAGADGKSNSSDEWIALAMRVEDLIRQSARALIAGHADRVARLIMAQLAHEHGLRPGKPRRDDDVAAWIKRHRNKFPPPPNDSYAGAKLMHPWDALDILLDDYREHADCGVPLDKEVQGPHSEE